MFSQTRARIFFLSCFFFIVVVVVVGLRERPPLHLGVLRRASWSLSARWLVFSNSRLSILARSFYRDKRSMLSIAQYVEPREGRPLSLTRLMDTPTLDVRVAFLRTRARLSRPISSARIAFFFLFHLFSKSEKIICHSIFHPYLERCNFVSFPLFISDRVEDITIRK